MTADLLRLLRQVEPLDEGVRTRWYRNPEGPEAADEIERQPPMMNSALADHRRNLSQRIERKATK